MVLNCIVPLAGPDYFNLGYAKGLIPLGDSFQLKSALETRPWSSYVKTYIFTLLDTKIAREFYDNYLLNWFPESKVVFLSHPTKGAAFSSLAALSNLGYENNPIVFDLGDIFFKSNLDLFKLNHYFREYDALALTFESNIEKYSYLEIKNNLVVKAAEKKIISNRASAGVYFYKNISNFLEALGYVIKNPEIYLHNDLLYLSPIFNGLIQNKGKVREIKVNFTLDPN